MTNYQGIKAQYDAYVVGLGEQVQLRLFDINGNEITDLKDYTFVVNTGENLIKIRDDGRVMFSAGSDGSRVVNVKANGIDVVKITIIVIDTTGKYYSAKILPIFMNENDRGMYYSFGICTCRHLLDSITYKSSVSRGGIKQKFDDIVQYDATGITNDCNETSNTTHVVSWIDENRERLYARQAALNEMPDIDKSFVLLAAFAGIRNIYDLSRVNVDKVITVFKVVSPMARMFEDGELIFEHPSEELIESTIEYAHEITDFTSDYATFVAFDDPEPTYLLDTNLKSKTDTDVIYEALQFLKNISISLPLPRTISGKVVMERKQGDGVTSEEQEGYKVTLTGIANPSSDKSEDDEDIHAYTDEHGKFTIVMPDKYNMQETVKFTVSYDEAENRNTAMNLDESAGSKKSAVFVKRASEILKAEHISYCKRCGLKKDENGQEIQGEYDFVDTDIPALLLLEKLDTLFDCSNRAKKLQDELYEDATLDYNLQELDKQISKYEAAQKSDFIAIRDELSYHILSLIKERDNVSTDKAHYEDQFRVSVENGFKKRIRERRANIRGAKRRLQNASEEMAAQIYSDIEIFEREIEKCDLIIETSKEEANELYNYIRDNNYDYDNDVVVPNSKRDIKRSELVDYLKKTKLVDPTVKKFLEERDVFDRTLSGLDKRIAFLESLVKFCETHIAAYDDEEDEQLETADREDENCETTDEEVRLAIVESEHQDNVVAVNDLEWFESQLADLVNSDACEKGILERKYKKYKSDTDILKKKNRQKEALEKEKDVKTKEDIFADYISKHSEDERVKEYISCREQAKDLFAEIQDIDDTVGVANEKKEVVSEVAANRRQRNGSQGSEVTNDNASYSEKKEGWLEASVIQTAINNILSKSMDAEFKEPFKINEERFIGKALKPRALPTVRLMGEGREEIELPTDTAPARVFNYSIMQRLVEPFIKRGKAQMNRIKIDVPIDVMDFKEKLYNVDENLPVASSLGIGYILNMHQAWIPDGFALGTLLYSMVLAPGEEQRIVVREHTESYTVNDEASVEDTIRDKYQNDQIDHETAAFEQAVIRASEANSGYSYETVAKSASASASGGWGPFSASASASYSKNTGKGSASAAQNDNYDEISTAAQDFQTSIKTQSERLAAENKVSIRAASSTETESVSSKIVANHNHSHVMTVQYWEVTRRYKMETCIEGIDLVLFVPLKPICFLPGKVIGSNNSADGLTADQKERFGGVNLEIAEALDANEFSKKVFNYRYKNFIRYADVLDGYIPRRYRGGLELIKKYSAYPSWRVAPYIKNAKTVFQLKLEGYFLECDDITATLHFNRTYDTVEGELESSNFLSVHPSMNTRKDYIYAMKKLRTGFVVRKKVNVKDAEGDRTYIDEYKIKKVPEIPALIFTFYLPSYLDAEDISYININNNLSSYSFSLSQNQEYLQDHELAAINSYEDQKWNFAKDNKYNGSDIEKILHYSESLPECYTHQIQTLSRAELISIGGTKIKAYIEKDTAFTDAAGEANENRDIDFGTMCFRAFKASPLTPKSSNDDGSTGSGGDPKPETNSSGGFSEPNDPLLVSSHKLLASPIRINVGSQTPVLGYDELMKMEETFRHVTNNTMRYSQAVWRSLSEVERVMMLEQYTVDLDYAKLTDDQNAPADQAKREPVKIPLLNCINVSKPLGLYGNSMIFPFTYPQELAEKLGKTAGDIQDELYRYHTTNFRVPSTSISVPTKGMIGEAVLGRTNVSEKIDITRFWNWKDSDIDHIELDQSALNGHSLLENADTKDAVAPTQGVVATEHVNGSGLLNSLTSRAQPQFADVLSNTDIRGLMQNADNNATAGREQAVKATTDMTKSAITAASDIAKTLANKATTAAEKVGDVDNLKSNLKKMGLSEAKVNELADKLSKGEMSYSDAFAAALNAKEEGNATPDDPQNPGGGGGGGGSGSNEKSSSFSDILNYAKKAIDAGQTPVEMFNNWMKEKTGEDASYSEEDIKKIAEKYCIDNGTTMEAVVQLIDEMCKG